MNLIRNLAESDERILVGEGEHVQRESMEKTTKGFARALLLQQGLAHPCIARMNSVELMRGAAYAYTRRKKGGPVFIGTKSEGSFRVE